MGVPATTIGVDLMINTTGKATARLLGAPSLPFVVLPPGPAQPFTDLSPEEVRSRALVAVEQIVAIFTGKPQQG
jgi:hypothetical protein